MQGEPVWKKRVPFSFQDIYLLLIINEESYQELKSLIYKFENTKMDNLN